MVLFFRVVTITILIAYAIYMYRDIIKHKEKDSFFHMILYGIMGFVLNLLDTLGVGSNATQMAFFKLTKLSPGRSPSREWKCYICNSSRSRIPAIP